MSLKKKCEESLLLKNVNIISSDIDLIIGKPTISKYYLILKMYGQIFNGPQLIKTLGKLNIDENSKKFWTRVQHNLVRPLRPKKGI